MTTDQQLLRPADLAPRLGVSVSRVYQLISAGVLPHVRVAGAIRIPLVAWERWLAKQGDRALLAAEGRQGPMQVEDSES